jgi:hypothetical protein
VRLWDAATGEEFVGLPGHSSYVYSLAFSPDGKSLVSSSGDTTLRLWDAEPLRLRSEVRRAAEMLRPQAQGWSNVLTLAEALGIDCTAFTQAPAERLPTGPGRPRKEPAAPPAPKRPRGRPRKGG